jgi:hypothetical protein
MSFTTLDSGFHDLRPVPYEENEDRNSQPEMTSPKTSVRRRQFSRRKRLAFAVFCVIACGAIGIRAQQAERQREEAAAIEELGGIVYWPNPPVPMSLWGLVGNGFFNSVETVALGGSKATDAVLDHVKWLDQLRELDLCNTKVTDAGLEEIKGLTKLQSLCLHGTSVTDAGLERLQGLPELRSLCLDGTQVTDAGLGYLQGLTNLRFLHLRRTRVTDAGLEQLKAFTKLQTVSLGGTKVTDGAMKKFQQASRRCLLVR